MRRSITNMRHVLLFALALASCGSPSSSGSPSPTAAPTPDSPPPPQEQAVAAPPPPDVELHEWGLVDATLRDATIDVGAGPGSAPPAHPMPVRKPVLYAHLRDGLDQVSLSVGVRLPGGALLEHWPAGEASADGLRWPGVTVRRGACAQPDDVLGRGPIARDQPQREPVPARACDAPDGFCERFELPGYRTTDHDCLDVGGTSASLLFYRGSAPASALPIALSRAADGTMTASARRSMAGAPGTMLRIRETPQGVTIARAPYPGVGQSLTIATPAAPLVPADEHAALDRDLRALGLTESESDAFRRAWASTLFAGPSASGRRAARVSPERDVLLYWLPEDAVSALAALELGERVAVRRAILVRVDLTTAP